MKLIIMRGVSGSGKSTLAKKLALSHEKSVIYSTDDFFMIEGKYVFDPKKIGENHKKNQDRTTQGMKDRIPLIIIDNTNTQAWEMKPYVLAAIEHEYQIEIHEPEQVDIQEIMRRQNSRPDKNISIEIVERMLARFEKNLTIEKILNS